ncbi:MAG: chromosome partitioning protein ParA, partial [Bacteroidetes bacterium]|nr:chromosome partitioning protein ParA [Bacteroidota bacterium]
GGMSMQQMMQQLQQMSGQQQKLNQQIQQMLNDVQGNRLSTDMQQRLRQMAAQQDALRRQLKELSRNRELGEKALGDLKKVAEEMEETIRDLQRGRVDRPMVQRQQRILTRLLNATKSIQKRGKEEKREGKSADDIMRESPSELPPQEQAEQLRRALLRALESGYAPDYENLIKRYFELLQEQQTPASGE